MHIAAPGGDLLFTVNFYWKFFLSFFVDKGFKTVKNVSHTLFCPQIGLLHEPLKNFHKKLFLFCPNGDGRSKKKLPRLYFCIMPIQSSFFHSCRRSFSSLFLPICVWLSFHSKTGGDHDNKYIFLFFLYFCRFNEVKIEMRAYAKIF